MDCLQAPTQWTIVSIRRRTINGPLYQLLCSIATNQESHQSAKAQRKKTYIYFYLINAIVTTTLKGVHFYCYSNSGDFFSALEFA